MPRKREQMLFPQRCAGVSHQDLGTSSHTPRVCQAVNKPVLSGTSLLRFMASVRWYLGNLPGQIIILCVPCYIRYAEGVFHYGYLNSEEAKISTGAAINVDSFESHDQFERKAPEPKGFCSFDYHAGTYICEILCASISARHSENLERSQRNLLADSIQTIFQNCCKNPEFSTAHLSLVGD